MAVFIDTSAAFAALDADDLNHETAMATWASISAEGEVPITSNYVLVEAVALIARRLGFQAVRGFHGRLAPLLEVHWVDQDLHDTAVAAMLTAGRRDLSLVDCVSFELMRRLRVDTAFTFDENFRQQGFRLIP